MKTVVRIVGITTLTAAGWLAIATMLVDIAGTSLIHLGDQP